MIPYIKTGRRTKISVDDNKNEIMKLDGHNNERLDSLQIEIIEGRMEGKRGRGRPRQKLITLHEI